MFKTTGHLLNLFPAAELSSPVSASNLSPIRAACQEDAICSFRSALSSLIAALNAVDDGTHSWPVVQFYYSAFYSLRCILFLNNIVIYYHNNKPMIIKVAAGSRPSKMTFKGAGSSHIAVAKTFRSEFPSSPLNGDIDFSPAMDWLRASRERATYNEPMMNMSDRLGLLDRISRDGIRKALNTYTVDLPVYAFLAEDAIVAYPLYACRVAKQACGSLTNQLTSEIDETLGRLRDKSGPVSCLDYLK